MEANPISVLVVDDDPTMTAVIVGWLRGAQGFPCTVDCAATGAAARAELQRREYDLVLLDYQLPDEDGLAVLGAMADSSPENRPVVIMLTGTGSEKVAVEAMKLGARDYIAKGALNLPVLRRAISGALTHRRLERQLAASNAEVRRHHAQLEADLAMAREVQQALLPSQHAHFPPAAPAAGAGLRICHRWRPSHKVAGDYFAVIPLSDTRAGIFQCDVMGHGMRAALVTALVHGLLRENEAHAADPAAFLGVLNRHLHALFARVGDVIFASAVYAVADARTGEVAIANAGHPAPLHLQRGAAAVVPVAPADGMGAVLGLLPDGAYATHRLQLASGDALLLVTDGLYEVPGTGGEEFGWPRLLAAVGSRTARPSEELLDAVLAEVLAFGGLAGDTPLPDDACLVALDFQV